MKYLQTLFIFKLMQRNNINQFHNLLSEKKTSNKKILHIIMTYNLQESSDNSLNSEIKLNFEYLTV